MLYPAGKQDLMFRAALDVRGNHESWGRSRDEVRGSWDELCRRAREHHGTTVISHELFAAATRRQITAAMTMLNGLEVHVVVTARDPARQFTAEWQEGVKHRRTSTFGEFRDAVLGEGNEHRYAQRFAASQDLAGVLARWSTAVRAERVHVVCCPPPDTDAQELWRLFGTVVGLDPERYRVADTAALNRSLGVAQIDLLRRVNAALEGRLLQPEYGRVVKRYFAQQLLAAHSSRRPAVPLEMYEDLRHVAERWQKEIEQAGYTVYGDLERLLPSPPIDPQPHPDDVDAAAEVATAAATIAELLVELANTQTRVAELTAEKKTLKSDKKTLKKKRKALKQRLTVALRS